MKLKEKQKKNLTIYLVYNTSDKDAHPYYIWIDSAYTNEIEAKARLELIREANGNRWASPTVMKIEVDNVQPTDYIRVDKP